MDEDPGDSNIDDSGFIDDFHDSDAEEELEQLHSEPALLNQTTVKRIRTASKRPSPRSPHLTPGTRRQD